MLKLMERYRVEMKKESDGACASTAESGAERSTLEKSPQSHLTMSRMITIEMRIRA